MPLASRSLQCKGRQSDSLGLNVSVGEALRLELGQNRLDRARVVGGGGLRGGALGHDGKAQRRPVGRHILDRLPDNGDIGHRLLERFAVSRAAEHHKQC